MLFISLIISSIFHLSLAAPGDGLPKLMTKQSLDNIRYISKDGKITYYQNNSGDLKISSNYQVKSIKESAKRTQFLVNSSSDEKWIGIEEITTPSRPRTGIKMHTLSIGKFGQEKTSVIGKGRGIQFQLNNRFVTYFNPQKRKIYIKDLATLSQTRSVQIFDKTNTLFTPRAFFSTENDLIFTDINSKGISAVLSYSISDKKFSTIFKSSMPGMRINICFMQDHLIIGEFPKGDIEKPSQIFKVNLFNNPNYKERQTIYNTPNADIGNMVCKKDEIFFIKTVRTNNILNSKETVVASINAKSSKLSIQSHKSDITQLTKMGNYILSPYRGSYLIVSGNTVIIDDSIQKGPTR